MSIKYDRTLNDVSEFFKEQGFYYSNEQIYNFYCSLITKPFVILSGISGSGKSKIVDLFSDYMSKAYSHSDNYELISVKPNWTDSRGIFGYHNLLNDTYQITPAISLFIRALENPDKPYFLVLDEMNLAKVEHYFSDFLSIIESRKYINDFDNVQDYIVQKINKNFTLSHAIILSALQLNDSGFKTVSDYRDTAISKWWLTKNSKTENPTAQYRSELNQGRPKDQHGSNGYRLDGSRLAGKAFWSETGGNSYQLKQLSEMDTSTRDVVNHLKTALNQSIKQNKIILHNFDTPLPTFENQAPYNGLLLDNNTYYVPNSIEIPLNVFIIGTVNVDETTYMFSPKVLDRSNVMEFNDIDLFNAYGYIDHDNNASINSSIDLNKVLDLNITLSTSKDTVKLNQIYHHEFEIIIQIFTILKNKNKHFGYRTFNEISSFIINYCGTNATKSQVIKAVDIQLLQKILPKINGSQDEIIDILTSLQEISYNNDLKKSQEKINSMISTLENTGYVTFIE